MTKTEIMRNDGVPAVKYQKKGLLKRDVKKGDKVTIVRRYKEKYLIPKPKDWVMEVIRNQEMIDMPDVSLPTKRIKNYPIREITLDSLEAYILQQEPRLQEKLRQKQKERPKQTGREMTKKYAENMVNRLTNNL